MSGLRVICLAGATGSGKTAAAIALAHALDGEVINADSRQVYADFPIITAQPTVEEQAACPHQLYGFLPTAERLSAGRWAEMALQCARAIAARGRVPILVGGTGFYMKALLDGIADIPPVDAATSRHWQARCAAEGPEALHALLRDVDPPLAARLHPRDSQRIVRGLEVWQGTGQPLSHWHTTAARPPACEGLRLGLAWTLDALTPRLDARIDAMLAAGALGEARTAMTRCGDADAPGWSGIGCAELLAHLTGRMSWQEARAQWLRNTRAYAKRQITWFRGDTAMHWFAPNDIDGLRACAEQYIQHG